MPVMNDEVPDEGDFDANRHRGEFDDITPEDFIRGMGNPPGWLPSDEINRMPTPGLSDYYDPRQHAIALCYVVPIAGDCKPQDETLDVEWVDPSGDMLDTFVGQMANGYGTIVRQALAWTGK